MKKTLCISLLLLLTTTVFAFQENRNLFVVSGKDSDDPVEKSMRRGVFFIEIPGDTGKRIHIRVFDADMADTYDIPRKNSATLFRVFGKGVNSSAKGIPEKNFEENDPVAYLRIGEDRFYDAKWRTIASLDPSQGQPVSGGRFLFTLVIEGDMGQGVNKYGLFVSSREKENTPVNGIEIRIPKPILYLPPAPDAETQIAFRIPEDSNILNIFNFDADRNKNDISMALNLTYRDPMRIRPSGDGKVIVTKIGVDRDMKGKSAGIVIQNRFRGNYIRLWITDEKERNIPFLLPLFRSRPNHLPEPDFQLLTLSECTSVVLDASTTKDKDRDLLSFVWHLPGNSLREGSRVVWDFERPGDYPVTLDVTDNSGFVANGKKLTKIIHINAPPVAVIRAPEKGIPDDSIEFDGALSSDPDGSIRTYEWRFSDGKKFFGKQVSRSFDQPGKYEGKLFILDNSDSPCNFSELTHIIRINAPPVPHLVMKTIVGADESILLDAGGSIDSDGSIREYIWDFGDGSKGSGVRPSHAWKKPGTYKILLTVVDDADLANSATSMEADIVVNAQPEPQIKVKTVVSANEEIRIDGSESIDPDGEIRKYIWDTGDNRTAEGASISHAYKSPGIYTIRLTVTDNTDTPNNTTSTETTIRVNDPPVPKAGADRILNSSVVRFDASESSDTDDPIIDYSWDFGDGSSANGKTVSHTYAKPGRYNVTLTVTDDSGTKTASISDQAVIRINHPPVPDAGPDRTLSIGEETVFDAAFSGDPDGHIVSFEWEPEAGKTVVGKRITYAYQKPGVYQARLTTTDDQGARTSDYCVIRVNHPPIADFFPLQRMAPGKTETFDARCATDPDGKIVRAIWDFNDGSPAIEGLVVKHAFKDPGRYTVSLVVMDDSGVANGVSRTSRLVEVNFPPHADPGPNVFTCDHKIVFNASKSSDPDQDSLLYHWDLGDGTTAEGFRVAHQYAEPGIYPVSLTVDDGKHLSNSTDRAAIIAHINAFPSAVIQTNGTQFCTGEFVLFDAGKSSDPEGGMLRYFWDFGDGAAEEGVNPVHMYQEGGHYRIKLTVVDGSGLSCNTSSTESLILVVDAPMADAGKDVTVCANAPVTFDGSESKGGGREIKSFEWDFGDDQFGAGIKPTHVYASEGEYKARLVITVAGDGECENSSEDTVVVRVNKAPVAVFKSPDRTCPGKTISFDASGSTIPGGKIVAYNWDFRDGNTGKGEKISHSFNEPGRYDVLLRIRSDSEGACATAEFSKTVIVNAQPEPVVRIISEGKAIAENPADYTTTVSTPLHFNAMETSDSDGYIKRFHWTFGDGSEMEGPWVEHRFETPGKYIVKLTVTDDSQTKCNTSKAQAAITVKKLLRPVIEGPDQTCAGTETLYSIQVPEKESLTWTCSDGSSYQGPVVKKEFSKPGNFVLIAESGYLHSLPKTIRVQELPEIGLPDSIEADPDGSVSVQPVFPKHSGVRFSWEMGDGTTYDQTNVKHVYKKSGMYTIHLTVAPSDKKTAPDCLKKEYRIPVTVPRHPKVEIRFQPGTVFTGGARDEVDFIAETPENPERWNYSWDFGDGGTEIGQNVRHLFQKPGKYRVVLTLSDSTGRSDVKYQVMKTVAVHKRNK